jgi:hypothetical protein
MLDHCLREAADHRLVPFLHFDPQCLDLGAQLPTFGRRDSFGRALPLTLGLSALASKFLFSLLGLLAPALQLPRVGWA